MSKVYHVRGPAGSRRVFLALPTYDGKLHAPCLHSLLKSLPELEKAGIGYDVYVLGGNCHVDDSRNTCVREFLMSDCDDLMFLDADVGWKPENLVKILQYDKDVVAGVYPKKSDNEEYPVHVLPDKDLYADHEGLVEVAGAPTGFMRIRRNVFEKLREFSKERSYFTTNKDDPHKEVPYHIIFERTFDQGYRLSGDYAFCFKWRFLGGKIFVDPEMYFVHEGAKEYGGGTLADWWKERYGVKDLEITNAIQDIKDGKDEAKAFQTLYKWHKNPYAASPELLWVVYKAALSAKGTILETGSGLTTIALALASMKTGNKVISLEHDTGFLAQTTNIIRVNGLHAYCDVRLSPIKNYGEFSWYTAENVPDLSLVICDGPPRMIGRKGLYHVLKEQIKNASVIMDDANDPAELINIQEWSLTRNRKVEVLGDDRLFAISAA